MKRKTKLWLFGIGCVIFFVTAFYLTGPLRWLGSPAIAVLSHPTQVETFKLNGRREQPETQANTFEGYRILARGKSINSREAARLGRSFLSPKDYLLGNFDLAACRISPGVGFRFWKDKQSVDVAVCFLCGHILVSTRDDRGKVIHRCLAPFSVQKLTGFVRRSFPNDPAMQGALSIYEGQQKE